MHSTPKFQIAALDHGFVYVGTCSVENGTLTVEDAKCVRRWGTTAGLGEIALFGPTQTTVLDNTGRVTAPTTSLLFLIDCAPEAWATHAQRGRQI